MIGILFTVSDTAVLLLDIKHAGCVIFSRSDKSVSVLQYICLLEMHSTF